MSKGSDQEFKKTEFLPGFVRFWTKVLFKNNHLGGKMKSTKKLLFTLSAFMLGASLASVPALAAKKQMKLVSVKTSTEIALDAVAEKAWDSAKALKVVLDQQPYKPNNGYDGLKETTVSIKSLYDNKNIYFYIQWDDPTESVERFPWIKQADGSWKQKIKKDSTGHENTYYEDKFGMYWEIKARGFKKKGCDIACHMSENGKTGGIADKSAGRKYTKRAGESIDMWHWKGVRTNALGMFDDQYVDHMKNENKNWGRHGDFKLGGGYKNNFNADKSGPAFMNVPYSEDSKYFVLPWSKTKFVDTFKTGDVIPGIVLDPFIGHRGDIKVKGFWREGKWTLEVKRSLLTSGEKSQIQDVQFSDMGKAYYFGMSVFDNTQINHTYHERSIELTFN